MACPTTSAGHTKTAHGGWSRKGIGGRPRTPGRRHRPGQAEYQSATRRPPMAQRQWIGARRTRLDVQSAVRHRSQQLHEHFPMTFGELPGVRPVKPSQRLFIEGDHPPAVGRRNDPQVHCHAELPMQLPSPTHKLSPFPRKNTPSCAIAWNTRDIDVCLMSISIGTGFTVTCIPTYHGNDKFVYLVYRNGTRHFSTDLFRQTYDFQRLTFRTFHSASQGRSGAEPWVPPERQRQRGRERHVVAASKIPERQS